METNLLRSITINRKFNKSILIFYKWSDVIEGPVRLKVLEYLKAILPKLFESKNTGSEGYVYFDESYMFDQNLCHDQVVVRKYISDLNEISDYDIVINEFKQINKLLKATMHKGIDLMNSSISEAEKMKKAQSFKNINDFVHDHNIDVFKS